jgi:CRP/FNR family transcriptional regulator, anaerobic regulatory protein
MLLKLLAEYLPNQTALHRKINKNVYTKTFAKGEIIHEVGDVCNFIGYITQGLVRGYTIADNGERITAWFKVEKYFLTLMNSYNNKIASPIGIEAIENTTIIFAERSFVQKLLDKYPIAQRIYKNEVDKIFVYLEKALIGFQQNSALDRYVNLLEEQPEILQRAPLGYIATYLGITQSTLSRIRAKHSKAKGEA